MKLKELYYKASEQERKEYNIFLGIGTKEFKLCKKDKATIREGTVILFIGLFMPVLWKIFEAYAGMFGIWMLEIPFNALPFIMGSTVGFAVYITMFTVRPKYNYNLGLKLVGKNFFKIHKQTMRSNALIVGLVALPYAFMVAKQLNIYEYGSGVFSVVLIIGFMCTLSISAIYANEIGNSIRYEVNKRLENE